MSATIYTLHEVTSGSIVESTISSNSNAENITGATLSESACTTITIMWQKTSFTRKRERIHTKKEINLKKKKN